jgi:hypothetical protein
MAINYRKIYEQHYGSIPQEPNGRSYDIHHIDGDHNNNDPSNLKAITVQEHYNIHYDQEDYGACMLIKQQRMELSPEERSILSSRLAKQRAKNGTHPAQIRARNGTHPFFSGDMQTNSNYNRVANGTHPFVGSDFNKANYNNGTHPAFLKVCCLGCKKEVVKAIYGRNHKTC